MCLIFPSSTLRCWEGSHGIFLIVFIAQQAARFVYRIAGCGPPSDDKISVPLGYRETGLVPISTYTADEIIMSGRP